MKKLLLLSLLVVGANSFGAIIGDQTVANGVPAVVGLPIRSTARVVEATAKQVIMEATTSGMNGGMMEFTFGDFKAGVKARKSLDGTFEVRLADNSPFTKEHDSAASSETNIAISFDANNFASGGVKTKTTTGNGDNGLPSGVDIAYSITGALNDASTKYMGNVNAVITIADTVRTAANCVDNTQRIYAKVSYTE